MHTNTNTMSGLVLEEVVMELALRVLDEDRVRLVATGGPDGSVVAGPLTLRRCEQVGMSAERLLELVRLDVAQIAISRRQSAYGLSAIDDGDAGAIEMAALDLLLGVIDHSRFWVQVALAY